MMHRIIGLLVILALAGLMEPLVSQTSPPMPES